MKVTIELPDYMEECPSYWQNFMHSPPFNVCKGDGFTIGEINNHLIKYGAYLIKSNRKEAWRSDYEENLVFESEEAVTMFILRFS